MKQKLIKLSIAAALILVAFSSNARTQTRVGVHLEFGEPLPEYNRYYISLGDYYGVSYREICAMHDAGVVDEDIPTILYIHANSQYSLRQIYSLRLNGATWRQLSSWCGVSLRVDGGWNHYVRTGPPGNAYGHYRNGHGKWKHESRFSRGGDQGHVRYWDDGDR